MKTCLRLREAWCLVAGCLFLALNAPAQPTAPLTAPAVAKPALPEADLDAALETAKVTEEGDADPNDAQAQYRDIVRRFYAQRPKVAEALFRIAEIAREAGDNDTAQKTYLRITTEFGDIREVASRAARRLIQQPPSNPYSMSPELMRRYGLMPPNVPGSEPHPAMPGPGMPPSLMSRYGIGTAPGVPAAAEPAATQLPEPPPVTAPPPPRVSSDPASNLEIERLLSQIERDRAEAAQLSTQLRQIRRQLMAGEGPIEGLATSLIQDPYVHRSLDRMESLKEALNHPAERAEAERLHEALERTHTDLEGYLKGTYRDRLNRTQKILERERDELLEQAAKAEAAVRVHMESGQ
jgi:hypothetical protein